MDNRYIDTVISEMQMFLDENGFEKTEDYTFKNKKKAVKVDYSEERQMYLLFSADIDEDGKVGEFSEIEAWLFDDSQFQRDAEAVGIDFVDTLRKNLGIKNNKRVNLNIDLPSSQKGDKYTVLSFTKKALDTFPSLKDEYKVYIEKYGNFLYLNFFGEYLVPKIKAELLNGDKKSAKKIFDLVDPAYKLGDKDTVNAVVACLAAASYENEKASESVAKILQDNSHFLSGVEAFKKVLKSKKQIREILIK